MVRFRTFAVLAVALAVAACAKTSSQGESAPVAECELIRVELSAQTEDALKTTLEGLSPKWLQTDKLSLFGAAFSNSELSLAGSDGSKAFFSGEAEASGPWVAAYPYSPESVCSAAGVTISIPQEQILPSKSCVADGALVAVGSTADLSKGVALKNVTSLLKITLAIDQADMNSVTVRSNDGSALTGRVTVNPATGEVISVEEGSDVVVLKSADGTFQGGNYYIAVIPGEHKGLTIDFTRTSDARKAERSSESVLHAKRSGSTNLGGFDDYTLEWEYLIDSYEDLMAYAGDAENWVVGEDVELRADIDMQSIPWEPLTFTQGGGTFKGNGHKIYNLIVDPDPSVRHCGFFGEYYKSIDGIIFGSKDGETWDGVSYIKCNNSAKGSYGYAAPITFPKKNVANIVNFCNVTIPAECQAKSRCGGICAFVEEDGITITGCTNYGRIETFSTTLTDISPAQNTCLGGIAGGLAHQNGLLIENCDNYGDVISHNVYTYAMGGILGEKYSKGSNTNLRNCRNFGSIKYQGSGTEHKYLFSIGGIIGQFAMNVGYSDCSVENCKNYGLVYSNAVTSAPHVGGICGRLLGGTITGCENEGDVQEDFVLAVSFTGLGGIVGYIYSGFADAGVENCTNRGNVDGKTNSIGFENKEDGIFHGTAAGGIAGISDGAKTFSGNNNYGSVSLTQRRKGTSTYTTVAQAGGILGYDKGCMGSFSDNHNWPGADVSAAATSTSSSKYEEICAGGVVGKLTLSTMYIGINQADVSAAKAASGVAYAGSIAGINNSTIATCYYGGMVGGVAASASNTVGSGTAPLVAGPVKAVEDYNGGLEDLGSEDVEWDE